MALETIFAGLDNNLPAGRVGTAAVAAVVGGGAAAGLAHYGVGGLQMNPTTVIAGAAGGLLIEEGLRYVAVEEEKFLEARTEGLEAKKKPLSERLEKLKAEKAKKAS